MKKSRTSLLAIGVVAVLAGFLPRPEARPQTGQDPASVGATDPTSGTPQVPGTAPPGAQVVPLATVGNPSLSIVLVIDVSGSMGQNNKMANAKQAALEAIGRYLTPGLQAPPTLAAGGGDPAVAPRPPAVSLDEAARLDRFREMVGKLEELQNAAGDLGRWTAGDMKRMREMIDRMDGLMEGVQLEKSQALLRRLNPLVEKMHFSIAKKVNDELGGGMRYMVSGKKSNHPDFGGLYATKMSDHDAIYVGKKADQAADLHNKLAKEMLGDDWLRRTDSALESGAKTFKAARTPAARARDFGLFEAARGSNNDWMRTVSGGGWVSDYVVQKGEVIDLDRLATNVDDARQSLSQATSFLKANGVSFDPRGPGQLGYNLGAVSDFDRQYMLNLERRRQFGEAMEKASVLQKQKYMPRFESMLRQTGSSLPPELANLGAEIDAAAKGTVTAAQAQALEGKFAQYRAFVRQAAADHQVGQYRSLLQRAAEARNSNPRLAEALISMADELADDTQGAIHNYQQLQKSANAMLGGADPSMAADAVLERIGRAGGGKGLATRVAEQVRVNPFVADEVPLSRTVAMERVAAFGTPGDAAAATRATRAGGQVVIRSAQRYRDYIRNNPGTSLLYVAGLGWVGYDVYDALQTGDVDRAQTSFYTALGQEGATALAEYLLATKYGMAAGSGGAVVGVATLAGLGGYALSKSILEGRAESRGRQAADALLSGRTQDNAPVPGKSEGFLEYLGVKKKPTPEEIDRMFPPGEYPDTRIEVDPRTGEVTVRRKTTKLTRIGGDPVLVDDWNSDVTKIPRNQLLANVQMGQLFDELRGRYRDALDGGSVTEAGRFANSYSYDDGFNKFEIPNPGGALSEREFVFYRKMFDDAWGKYTLGQQPWPADDLMRAKRDMFERMMKAAVEGKQQDMQFAQALDQMTPDEMEVLRDAIAAGDERFLDGRKLSVQDLEDRIELARSYQEGALRNIIDKFQDSAVPPEFEKEIDVLVSMTPLAGSATPGDVEFGILAYSGGCNSKFWFHPFSREYGPLRSAIEALSPGGATPMTPALYQARWAIWTEGAGQRGAIILLTDGQNDCAESPVDAAKKIYTRTDAANPGGGGPPPATSWLRFLLPAPAVAAQDVTGQVPGGDATSAAPASTSPPKYPGYHQIELDATPMDPARARMPISVHTVGFQVNDRQQKALEQIAAAGGGMAVRAENAADLALAFDRLIGASTGVVAGGGGGGVRRGGIGGATLLILALTGLAVLLAAGLVAARAGLVPVGPTRPGLASGLPGAETPPPAGTKIDLAVKITGPDGSTRERRFRRAPVSVGRSSANDLVLEDSEASRDHARIVVESGRLWIEDRGSTAGVIVDGRSVDRAEIRRGSEIRLGATRIRIP